MSRNPSNPQDEVGGDPKTLGVRTIESAFWATGANATVMALVGVRSVILARLLSIDVFGVYALAGATVALAAVCGRFGLDDAFLHRAPETKDEQAAASVHFSLNLLLGAATTVALAVGAFLFTEGAILTAFYVLAACQFGLQLTLTPRAILRRRVTHRRLAALNVTSTAVSTAVAIAIANCFGGLWALLAVNVVTSLVTIAFLYTWNPVWRPRLAWDKAAIRYFVDFGSRNVVGHLVQEAIARVDKLWVGVSMPADSLGLYSRAYAYALAPIAIISRPVSLVFGGTFAELAKDASSLSRTVSSVAFGLFRGTCLLVGVVGLIAPEMIALVIGPKWLPMVDAFRILLAAFLGNPIMVILSRVAVGVGRPGVLAKVRLAQLATLLAAMIAIVPLWDFVGVAISVMVSSYVGLALLLLALRHDIDLSVSQLFTAPLITLTIGLVAGASVSTLHGDATSLWIIAGTKTGVFLIAYISVLVLLEGRRLKTTTVWMVRHLRDSRGALARRQETTK